jgi:hypothetical protein
MPDIITTGGQTLIEPDWRLIYSDIEEVNATAEHWRIVAIELRDRDLLSPINSHSLQRYVLLAIMFDRLSRHIAEHGAVTPANPGNPKLIPRVSPARTSMREAGAGLIAREAELGLLLAMEPDGQA